MHQTPYLCNTNQNNMTTTNFTLKFGKYKGQNFRNTPQSYQDWLLSQDWFKLPTEASSSNLSQVEKAYSSAHNSMLKSNYSEQSIDVMFQAEQMLDEAVEYDRKYYGMNAETKQAQMDWDYAEIVACNAIHDYYNA